MGEVVRLIENAPGISVDGHDDLMVWAREWLDGFARGEYGRFRSLVMVVETSDGRLATISQSVGLMDGCRLVGTLMAAAHRKMDGAGQIDDLRVDDGPR